MIIDVPCRMGDEVWAIRNFQGQLKAVKTHVSQMVFLDDMRIMIVARGICRGLWGERIFATQEEAEAEIKRRDKHVWGTF